MTQTNLQRPLKILLADDGSEHARAAVSMLCALPLPPRSSVTAVAVLSPLQAPEHSTFKANLEHTRSVCEAKGVTIETELLLGYPAEVLVEWADQNNPDLIVMGAKGLRATLGILLGGVAQQVVEYANWPVLVVRAPFSGLQRVLFVIDGSECSWRALEYFAGASEDYRPFPLPLDVNVQVLHVLPPVPVPIGQERIWLAGGEFVPPPPVSESQRKAWAEEEEREGQTLLNKATRLLKSAGLQVSSVLRRGDAATEILDHARSHQADLIICGSRGLSQVKGWLLGSVSRKLLHYSGCSVLVVKTRCEPGLGRERSST